MLLSFKTNYDLAHETSNEVTVYLLPLEQCCITHTADASHQAPQDNSA